MSGNSSTSVLNSAKIPNTTIAIIVVTVTIGRLIARSEMNTGLSRGGRRVAHRGHANARPRADGLRGSAQQGAPGVPASRDLPLVGLGVAEPQGHVPPLDTPLRQPLHRGP